MTSNSLKIANWHLLAICIMLALAAFFIKPAMGQTYAPLSYWTFENSVSLKDSMNVYNLDPNYYQGTYAINNNSPGVGVGKYLTLNTTTTSLVKAGVFGIDSSFTVEFLFRPGQGFNATNFFGRFDGAIGARMEYPAITFYTTCTGTSGGQVYDEMRVDLNGIGKKDYGYYVDGNWHHFVFRYSANTGVKEIWIDGSCPSGFSKTTATGYFVNTQAVQRDFYFNSSANYLKYFGDMDEMAIYKYSLHPNMIYKHYQNAILNHQHYSFTWTTTTPPAAGPTTAGLNIVEFAPGHPNYTVSAVDQLKTFPTPRYKPGHSLQPNFSWMDQAYFGSWQQPGVSYAQAVANSLSINMELARYFNFNLPASQNTSGYQYYNDTTKFSGAWVKQCNQNPQYPCAAITFWAQLNPTVIGKPSSGPYIWSSNLPVNHYLRNSSGQFLDPSGNVTGSKYWSPAAPNDSLVYDGLTQKFYLQSLLSSLTRPLNYLNDNGETYPFVTQYAANFDPAVVAQKNASGMDWSTYLGNRKKNACLTYRNQFMTTLSGLANTKYSEYQICGQPTWSHKYSETRSIQTPINGTYYSTPDFYVRYPNNWRYWQSAWHGWQWIVDSRNYEIPLGDKYFSPFVAPGWDNNEENNVRPAQYLGLLKCLSMVGAEFFYPGFFSLNAPYADPRGYAWQAVMPAYAQGLTSRYEDLFRNGYVMNGDIPNDYINPTFPGYTFKCGDLRKLILVRKSNTGNRYVISGTIQPNNSMIGGAELEGNTYITLDGQTVKFKVRRQGSTYIYDNTNPSAPVFYQLDEWHENKHPYLWTKDFNMEAELFDNTNANAVIKTGVPNGTAAGDFTTFTTRVTFNAVSSLVYNFIPRGTTPVTYYLWIRMRSKDGTATGVNTQLDNGTTQLMDCVKDTTWTWYRFNASTQQAISYASLSLQNHTLTLTPTNTKLEIDKITISTSNTTYSGVVNPCSGAVATITAGGPTTFCQGGTVTLTANAGTAYAWSNGANTQSITVSTSGTYTVTVTTALGTATSSPVTITVNALPAATITANGSTSICQGSTVTLTASSGTSYLWSNGATTQAITTGSQGSYNVRVTSSSGCSKTSSNTNVTVNALPTATITTGGPTTFCSGGSVNLTASSGSSYLWTPGSATTQTINVTSAGSYSVKVTNAAGCSANSANTTVTVNALPTATITANGPTTFAPGGSVTLTASSGSSYLWLPGNQTSQSITVTTSGTYTVRVTNSSGCSKTSAGTVVTVTTGTATITASGPLTFCQGGSVTLTASSGTSYLWSTGATTQAISVTTSGTYSCTVGGSGTAPAKIITVNALPTATITANGPTSICQGSTVTLTSSSGTSYLWSNGATTQAITTGSQGSYSVRVTNSSGCSKTSSNTNVIVNALPTATITAGGSTTFCSGGSVNLTASSGSSYLWTPGNQTSQTINVTSGGAYSVKVTNASGCSANSVNTTVTVNALPTATITASGPTTFTPGGSVILTSSAGSGYLWSPGNQTTQSITVTTSGTYTVRVTNSNGCTKISAGTVVTVTSGGATISASGPLTFCQGGSVTLTASTGTSYLWSNGAITKSITVTASGSYSCVIGGVGTAPAQVVTVNALPTATITAGGATTFCSGGSVTLTSSAGSSYLWSPGNQTTPSIQASSSGSYTVRVTGSNGCSKTSSPVSVTATPVPNATITASGPTTFCTGGSVTLTAGGGTSYIWHPNGQSASAIFIQSSGSFSVTAYNGSCSATSQATVVTVTNCTACPVPTGLTTTGITTSRATLNWPVSVIADTFEVKLQNTYTGGIASGKFLGSVHSVTATGLSAGRTYNWWVRSICGGTTTAWSATAAFTTPLFRTSADDEPLNEPFAVTDIIRQDQQVSGIQTIVDLYPNPAGGQVTLFINTPDDSKYVMELMDYTGKRVLINQYNCLAGPNSFPMSLEALPKGIYFLRLVSGSFIENKKLILQ